MLRRRTHTFKDDCGAAPAVEQAGGFRLKSFNLLKTKHICLVTILAILSICALLHSTQVQLIEDKNGIGGHRGEHCPGCKLREGRQLKYVQVNNEDNDNTYKYLQRCRSFMGGVGAN